MGTLPDPYFYFAFLIPFIPQTHITPGVLYLWCCLSNDSWLPWSSSTGHLCTNTQTQSYIIRCTRAYLGACMIQTSVVHVLTNTWANVQHTCPSTVCGEFGTYCCPVNKELTTVHLSISPLSPGTPWDIRGRPMVSLKHNSLSHLSTPTLSSKRDVRNVKGHHVSNLKYLRDRNGGAH